MSGLMKNNDELPKGWMWKKVSDLGEVLTGTTPSKAKKEYYDSKDYPFFKPTDLNEGYYVKKSGDGLSKKGIEEARLLPAKSILITCIGATIGKTGLIRVSGAFNQQINAIIPQKDVLPEFVYFVCISPQFQKSIVDNSSATTLPILNKRKFEMLTMPIPPLIEQQKIVEEIEKQFSRLDEAVAALKRVRASLKRYKASVLKAAVEGKLTEEWRKQNTNVEPADKLLKRILAERKKKWEEANSKKKYKEPAAPDTSSLPDLPKGWVWINFVRLASDMKNSIKRGPFGSAIKKAFFVQKGYKVYEQQNAIYNNHKLGNYYINEEKYNELIDFTVKPCDFIISCSGTIGKIAQIPESAKKGIINQALLKITIDNKLVLSKYFLYLFKSDVFQKMFLKDIRGTAMKNIASVEDLKLIPVALPPLHEQTTIVEEIESRLSVAEEIEETIDINLKRTERLRQAILKKAFSGKLITQ